MLLRLAVAEITLAAWVPCKGSFTPSGGRRITAGVELLARPIATAEFLVVDTETNGLGGERCELTEVGTVLVGGGELHDRWSSLVRTSAPLRRGIQRFTGISQAMVDDAPSLEQTVDRGVRDQMARGAFPVAFDDVGAAVEFRLLDGEPHRGAGYEVDVIAVRHPGGALGYRFRERNAQAGGLVYISDNELGSHPGYDSRPGWRGDLVGFIRGSRLLVHDAMYTVEEYAAHRGWGHSSDRDVVELALEAAVETLVLFHHKPERTDDEMDGRVDACRKVVAERGSALKVLAAAEGLTLTV